MKIIPLIQDPTYACLKWLKLFIISISKNEQVQITSTMDSKLKVNLELSIKYGKVLIIQDVNCIEPYLLPLLRNYSSEMIGVGRKSIRKHKNFRCILVSKCDTSLAKKMTNLVPIITFSTSRSGMRSKLLTTIISHVAPELEEKSRQIMNLKDDLQLKLNDLENSMLDALEKAGDSVLQNDIVLEKVKSTKHSYKNFVSTIKKSTETRLSLKQQREEYSSIAELGADIFSAIQQCREVS